MRAIAVSLVRLLRLASLVSLLAVGCAEGTEYVPSARTPSNAATAIQVRLEKESQTICPRARVRMQVLANGHTEGPLALNDLEFRSPHGTFDDEGFFIPHRDVRATIATPYEIRIGFRTLPEQLSISGSYKPDYGCIRTAGTGGPAGAPGTRGDDGGRARPGTDAGAYGAGGKGARGGQGSPGGPGGHGGAGPRIEAFATFVTTPAYEKLLAVVLDGDVTDFVLALPDRVLVLDASGGPGGNGGDGGHGGRGGVGGSGGTIHGVGGNGGDGGAGGLGGNGGRGGAGGTIDLVYDARFPELASLIRFDVAGGRSGAAGAGGNGGNRAWGGIARALPGKQGERGGDGSAGAPGEAGPDGHASARPGSVETRFAGLPRLSVFSR